MDRGDAELHQINLAWVVKLRWGAVAGQLVTILIVHYGMHIPVPLGPLFVVVGAELVSNIGCAIWMRRVPVVREGAVAALLVGDVLLLTALLYFTGGPFNSFSFLYVVHVALAAIVLRPGWTWGLAALSVACLGALFADHVPLPLAGEAHANAHAHHSHGGEHRHAELDTHVLGMWAAMGVASAFIVYFVTRVRGDLARRDVELQRARAQSARAERLASLATLAAGAAHELSTPLSTIAVAARELERELQSGRAGEEAVGDAQLIRTEVERCRDILGQMAVDAGENAGEGFRHVAVSALIAQACEGVSGADGLRVEAGPAEGCSVFVPLATTARALRAIIKNAQQAAAAPVTVRAAVAAGVCRLEVADQGPGMAPEVLARVGEPFFTTRPPGAGMGLGVFLARAVVERLGGRLDIDSAPGRGTSVSMALPLSESRAAASRAAES